MNSLYRSSTFACFRDDPQSNLSWELTGFTCNAGVINKDYRCATRRSVVRVCKTVVEMAFPAALACGARMRKRCPSWASRISQMSTENFALNLMPSRIISSSRYLSSLCAASSASYCTEPECIEANSQASLGRCCPPGSLQSQEPGSVSGVQFDAAICIAL